MESGSGAYTPTPVSMKEAVRVPSDRVTLIRKRKRLGDDSDPAIRRRKRVRQVPEGTEVQALGT